MSKAQRVKGHAFEREVARLFRRIFPDARRHLEYQSEQANGVDIDGVGKWRIQCKRHKNYVPVNTIEEIQPDGIHLLVTKADNKPTMAVMRLDDLLKILTDIGEAYHD